ncbi:MAG: hypothetical protein M2R45_01834 [Verrucomicrobia subdivision 3 bacterium]|nr:hypothetical protein [Limisphaerales bacterium]MCS1415634.1 hypothetical protein [Limisphaerales bacterium]
MMSMALVAARADVEVTENSITLSISATQRFIKITPAAENESAGLQFFEPSR